MPAHDNPYQSPLSVATPTAAPSLPDAAPTRGSAAIEGMRRGAQVGAIGVAIFTVVAYAGVFVFVERPAHLNSAPAVQWLAFFGALGLAVVIYAIMGGILGAVILGAIAAIRFRSPTKRK